MFFENGSGNYNTHNFFEGKNLCGYGSAVYNGGGLAARYVDDSNFYVEASLRTGKLKNTLNDALSDKEGNTYGYKLGNIYYGGHIGLGKVIKLDRGRAWDIYGKFFHAYHAGETVLVGMDKFHFDGVQSDRLRLGARFIENVGNKLSNYYGLAWEYEFNGDIKGSAGGAKMYASSLSGSTAMAEIGFRYIPETKSPWYFDANMHVYAGKRQGVSGSIQVNYTF